LSYTRGTTQFTGNLARLRDNPAAADEKWWER